MLPVNSAVLVYTPLYTSTLTVDSAEQLQQLRATLAVCQSVPSSRDIQRQGESGRGELEGNI